MADMPGPIDRLSAREREVLELASRGHTDHAIMARLGISAGTINTYWSRIRIKLGKISRAELVGDLATDRAAGELKALREENSQLLDALGQMDQHDRRLAGALSMIEQVVQTVPDALLVVDDKGVIQIANPEAEALFGYGKGELQSRHIRDLVPERFHGQHAQYRQEFMASPHKHRMGNHEGTSAMRKDGTEIPIVATLNACKTGEGMLVTCIMRPVDGHDE